MFPTDLKCLSDWKLKAFFNSFDVIFCDCDGVILSQQNVLSGIPDAIYALKQIGKKIMYVTNNTSISRRKMQEIFKRAAINVDVNDVINPAVAIGAYLQKIQFTKKVFVIGLPGLREDLTSSGVDIANEAYDTLDNYTVECLKKKLNSRDDNVGAVIICLDFNMTLLSLNQALNYLQDPNVLFIITGTEKTLFRSSLSTNRPRQICLGAGYVQNIVQDVTQRKPLGFGKPLEGLEQYLKCLIKEHNYRASRILFIGDSLNQDVLFAKKLGIRQLLVLTGNTKLKDLYHCNNNQLPDYYIHGLSELTTLLRRV